MTSHILYCRLCASVEAQANLQAFESPSVDMATIHHLNNKIRLGDSLPQTVCSQCIWAVETTAQFIRHIENAQQTLNKIFTPHLGEEDSKDGLPHTLSRENDKYKGIQIKIEREEIELEIKEELKEESDVEDNTESNFKITLPTLYPTRKKFDKTFSKKASVSNPDVTSQPKKCPKLKSENVDIKKPAKPQKKKATLRKKKTYPKIDYIPDNLVHHEIPDLISQQLISDELTRHQVPEELSHRLVTIELPPRQIPELPHHQVSDQLPHQISHQFTQHQVSEQLPSNEESNKLPHHRASELPFHQVTDKLSHHRVSNQLPHDKMWYELLSSPETLGNVSEHRWSDYWCCFRCSKNYKTLKEIRNHSIETHGRCVIFKCRSCLKMCNYKIFIRHMVEHHESLQNCCEHCSAIFNSQLATELHKKVEHDGENKAHACTKCGTGFDNADDLNQHCETLKVKKFICDHCDKTFPLKCKLLRHMAVHSKSNLFACRGCDSNFKHRKYLMNHESTVHGLAPEFACDICEKILKTQRGLKAHKDVHSGYKPYACDICKKPFRMKYMLLSHRLSHGGPKPYPCTICDKSFRYKPLLRQHILIHSSIKPYSCTVCVKDFSCWPNFNKHMKRIHGKNMAKQKVKTDDDIKLECS